MRGKPHLRWALLGLALSALPALAQSTPPVPSRTPPPTPGPYTAAAKPPLTPPAVAATVNTEPLYEAAVQRILSNYPPTRRAEARARVIDEQIGHLLIDQSLRTAGWKVETSEVDARINEIKTELKKVKQDFDKMLAGRGLTESELRQYLTADLRWVKYADTQVNDKVLLELFDKNKDIFDGTAVLAWHILLSPPPGDEKAAQAAQLQLMQIKKSIEEAVEAGLTKLTPTSDKLVKEKAKTVLMQENFAKWAKEKSECPTKARGGYVGWFQKAGFMTPPFSEAAFALPVGQISNVIKTPFGYHLILITDRKAGKEVKFEEVKEAVKEVFLERLHDRLVESLRPRAKIVVNPQPK
jgi:parvulin-like peptidyl-prolyl isomerase